MFRRVLRPRVLIYGAILLGISLAFVASIALRSPFKVDVIRDRGALARIVEDGRVENVYRLQIMNSTEREQRYRISVEGIAGISVASHSEVDIGPAESRWVAVRVQVPPESAAELAGRSSPIQFAIERLPDGEEAARTVREKSTFLVPR